MALVRKVGVTFAIVCTSAGYRVSHKIGNRMTLDFGPLRCPRIFSGLPQ